MLVWTTGFAVQFLVAIPTFDAVTAWERTQLHHLAAYGCPSSTVDAMFTAARHVLDAVGTWERTGFALLAAGFVPLVILSIWAWWLARPTRTQPARQ
jgi:hypothetical protein